VKRLIKTKVKKITTVEPSLPRPIRHLPDSKHLHRITSTLLFLVKEYQEGVYTDEQMKKHLNVVLITLENLMNREISNKGGTGNARDADKWPPEKKVEALEWLDV